jgi:hypothetical protein
MSKSVDRLDTNPMFFFFHFKGTYLHHKEIKAAQGIKITGQVIVIRKHSNKD